MQVPVVVAVGYTKAYARASATDPSAVETWLERALDRLAEGRATLDTAARLSLWASVRAYEHALVMHRDGSDAVPAAFEIDENA